MDSQYDRRCPHFQIYSEPLQSDGPPAYLAIRRCLMAERLVRFLRQSDDGSALADMMVVSGGNGSSFAFVGPDLEAVTQQTCVTRRCSERCTPAYAEHLHRFGLVDPHEDDLSCEESTEPDPETIAS